MKRVRFTEEQIIAVLREHEAEAKTADLARKHGMPSPADARGLLAKSMLDTPSLKELLAEKS
jgi:Transposase